MAQAVQQDPEPLGAVLDSEVARLMARLNAFQRRYLAEYKAGHGRCGHHNTRGARCTKPLKHGGMHRSASGKFWY
jgi:hypothetical protein